MKTLEMPESYRKGRWPRFVVSWAIVTLCWTGLSLNIAFAQEGLSTPNVKNDVKKKVLLIGVDGMHIDVMQQVETPRLNELVKSTVLKQQKIAAAQTQPGQKRGVQRIGFNTWETDERPSNGGSTPNWASILTGVAPDRHRLLSNGSLGRPHCIDDDGQNPTPGEGESVPTIFGMVKSRVPKLRTAVVHTWGGIGVRKAGILEYSTTSVDYSFSAPEPPDNRVRDRLNAENAVDLLHGEVTDVQWDTDLLFIHLGQTDTHATVFDVKGQLTPNAEQRMRNVDGLVGMLVDAVEARPTFEQEDWLIVVVADHGTDDNGGHIDNSNPKIRTVPYILNGRNVDENSLPKTPHSWDVAPLIVEHLCGPSAEQEPADIDQKSAGQLLH